MKIIRKPNSINQKCKLCGAEIEITHKELKRHGWKCPICRTKNPVLFIDMVESPPSPIVVATPKPKKRRKTVYATTFGKYLAANPPTIKIIDYKQYGVKTIGEVAATKIFELIMNGFNTPTLLSRTTGLSPASCVKYAVYLKNAKLISGTASTKWWTFNHIKYEKKTWRPSL